MGVGFEASERLSGAFHLLGEPLVDRAMTLTLRVVVDEIRPLGGALRGHVEGWIEAEGLAERAAVEGVVSVSVARERRQVYDLTFRADDGVALRLRGQRDFFLHSGLDALTVVGATLLDDAGEELGRARLRFDARADLGATARSLRVRVGSRWLGRRALSVGLEAPRLALADAGGAR